MKKTLVAAATLLATAAWAEPVTYAIDPDHAIVTFEALHLGTSTQRGRLQAKQGSVVLDRAAKTGKVDITVDLASVSVATASLNGFLKGDRFFNVAQNPTARFASESVTFEGDKLSLVSGTLTMMGKSQPVVLRATRFNCYQSPRAQQPRGVRRRLRRLGPAQPVRARRLAERHARRDPAADPGRGHPAVAVAPLRDHAFATKALHQPAPATGRPAKIVHGPVAAVAGAV